MKIATWNINGIKARHNNLVKWLEDSNPDIVCLQETKSTDDTFPENIILDLGYNLQIHGQKGFNGVAIASKLPFEEINCGLPLLSHDDTSDPHARFMEAVFSFKKRSLRVVSLYLPNGNPINTEKFSYKLAWMKRLHAWVRSRLKLEEILILAGDYNVIPQSEDCYNPDIWKDDALYKLDTRSAFRSLVNLGLTEAVRAVNDAPKMYTFWDYRGGAFKKNLGIRIDHILLSPEAADLLNSVKIDQHVRAWDKPSDHVPVCIELKS